MDKNTSQLRDLKVAHEELIMHRQELEKCTAELAIANEHLDSGETEHNEQKDKMNSDLEDLMFQISHKVRASVANIIGISKLLYEDKDIDVSELRELLHIIITSAESLNISTEELAKYIHKKRS